METTKLITLTEIDKLELKCAHLEFILAKERAEQQLKSLKSALDKKAAIIFRGYCPGEDIKDYSLNLEEGTFTPISEKQLKE